MSDRSTSFLWGIRARMSTPALCWEKSAALRLPPHLKLVWKFWALETWWCDDRTPCISQHTDLQIYWTRKNYGRNTSFQCGFWKGSRPYGFLLRGNLQEQKKHAQSVSRKNISLWNRKSVDRKRLLVRAKSMWSWPEAEDEDPQPICGERWSQGRGRHRKGVNSWTFYVANFFKRCICFQYLMLHINHGLLDSSLFVKEKERQHHQMLNKLCVICITFLNSLFCFRVPSVVCVCESWP